MGKGLVTMQDVEMAVAEGTSLDSDKHHPQFHLKKSLKLKVKQSKKKGKFICVHSFASFFPMQKKKEKKKEKRKRLFIVDYIFSVVLILLWNIAI
ncbi:hypothetical protein CsSME_00029526 [Camellia sinensis var. sinensis]